MITWCKWAPRSKLGRRDRRPDGRPAHALISSISTGRAIHALPFTALDAPCGPDHCSPAADWRAIGRRQFARETDEVPGGAWAHRGGKLQAWLAVCFAALLAIAPLTRPSLSVDLAAVPAASIDTLVADDGGKGKQPATGLRPAQAANLGILSRLSLLETTLELPPVKSPLLRPVPDQPVLAPGATTTFGGELRQAFQRSSVGTARTPTGPPA